MIKYEVNKVTKKDVDVSVADAIRYVLKNKEYDINPNKIQNAMYTGRNYTLSKLRMQSCIIDNNDINQNSSTNLMQVKDLSKYYADYILNDTPQVIGNLVCTRVKAKSVNCLKKSDLTIDKIAPLVQSYVDSVLHSMAILPVGANYVSDNDPSELLKGTWELKAETKIGKIWERVR